MASASLKKGEQTRAVILDSAREMVGRLGLEALTIGQLAERTGLSKSGVFAHFGSKEELQIAVLEDTAIAFRDQVLAPAMLQAPGRARLAAIFDGWLAWATTCEKQGGCVFVAGAAEYDDRPGPVRDSLATMQRRYRSFLAERMREAAEAGDLLPGLEPEQAAFEFFGIFLALHHDQRLLDDPVSLQRARKAFERLLS